MSQTDAPNLLPVTNDFADRRERLHVTKEQLAVEAELNRDTIAAVEKGGGSNPSRRKVHETLLRLEEEAGLLAASDAPASAAQPHLIEIEVTGDFGVRVVVKGPVEDEAEIVAAAMKLVRGMKDGGESHP